MSRAVDADYILKHIPPEEMCSRFVVTNAPTIEPQRWIPCSERLPEHSERYLVTAFDGTARRTTVVPYHPQNKTWTLTGRMAYWRVLAWMPLPEPYVDDIPIEYFESGGK